MSKRLTISLFILMVGTLLMAGCLSNDVIPNEKNVVPNAATPVEWNFIVYLDGDNNLESYAIDDMNEMEMIGSDANINILALVDRTPGYSTLDNDWTGTRLYKITYNTHRRKIASTVLQDYGELDMSDPTTLKNFIVDCQTLYPANRTVLTLWNHGDGFYPRSQDDKGICWDDTTGAGAWDCLTGDEVLSALSDARAITGEKIDILNMDACLMQNIELAYEWRTEIDYFVGSEETVGAAGNNYDGILGTLQNNPFQTTEDYAKALVNDYYSTYQTSSATYSVVGMGTEFTNLITAFEDFATAMYNTTDLAAVTTALTDTVYFTYEEYRDLYAFANNICTCSSDSNVVSKASALKTALSNAILLHKESGTFVNEAYGLSILLPQGTQWSPYDESNQYVDFLLSVDTDWDEFVKRYVVYTGGTV